MNLIDKAFMLKKSPLFRDLSIDYLFAIADKLGEKEVPAETPVFLADQAAHQMYIVISGEVELLSRDDQRITTILPFDHFGDASLFNDQPRQFHAICRRDSLLFSLSRSHLLTTLRECPSVAIRMLESYSQIVAPSLHTPR